MKKLFVLSATPGCGKSTWARKYQHSHPNTYIISSDDIRYELTGQYQDFSKQKEVWETFEKRIVEYGEKNEDLTVILDALCDLDELRIKYVNLAKNYDRKILVVFKKSKEDVLKFNHQRPKENWVPDGVIDALYDKFKFPSEEVLDIYDEYIIIDHYFN